MYKWSYSEDQVPLLKLLTELHYDHLTVLQCIPPLRNVMQN